MIANVGVYPVCEVYRRRARNEVYYLALRGKHIDVIAKEILAYVLYKFPRGVGIRLQGKGFSQPRKLAVQIVRVASAFLIHPVRRYAVFSSLVHFRRPYLHLKWHTHAVV